jgi:hypothetical protein
LFSQSLLLWAALTWLAMGLLVLLWPALVSGLGPLQGPCKGSLAVVDWA